MRPNFFRPYFFSPDTELARLMFPGTSKPHWLDDDGDWSTESAGFTFTERSEPTDDLPILCQLLTADKKRNPTINLQRLSLQQNGQLLFRWCPISAPLTCKLMNLTLVGMG